LWPPYSPQAAVRTELARRHPEALAKLLAKIIFGIEPTPACNLRDAEIADLQQARGFLEAFFFQEMAEKAAGDPMEAAGNVLPGKSQLLSDRFHGDFLVIV